MHCELCKAREDAHFGWCVSVDGSGWHPTDPFRPRVVTEPVIINTELYPSHPTYTPGAYGPRRRRTA